jgi:hypothetical protein
MYGRGKKGSSGLSTRQLIPCVGSQLSSVQLELGVCWASKLFWMQHTRKEINYVNSLVLLTLSHGRKDTRMETLKCLCEVRDFYSWGSSGI